jgi:hypothetical protein
VTGAAQGIGRAAALVLAREGGRALLSDINGDGAADAVRAIDAGMGKGTAFAMRHDVTSENDWKAAIAQVGSVGDLSLDDWRRGMTVPAGAACFLQRLSLHSLHRERQEIFYTMALKGKKTAQVNLRIDPALKEAAERAAAQDRRSLTSYVEKLIDDDLRAREAAAVPSKKRGKS